MTNYIHFKKFKTFKNIYYIITTYTEFDLIVF